MVRAMMWGVLGLGLAGVAHAAPLAARVAELERQVAELQARLDGAGAVKPEAAEEAAMLLYQQARDRAEAGDLPGAIVLLDRMTSEYKSTRAAGAASRWLAELRVVGTPVEALGVQRWLHGQGTLEHTATLLVFWEVWCPHCTREVPKLQERYAALQAQGIEVVALTSQSRGKTDADVAAFVAEHSLTFPVGVPEESFADLLAISGVPAAAVVKGGVVVWRGHPAQITDELVKVWAVR